MKKFLAAAAAVLFAASPAMADSPKVSGYLDIYYTVSADTAIGANPAEGGFGYDGEVDIENSLSDNVDVRVDLDFAPNTGNAVTDNDGGDVTVEQAYFTLKNVLPVTVTGGVFNNPVGFEGQDAPDLYTYTRGQISTAIGGSVAAGSSADGFLGLAFQGQAGPANVTLALVNEIDGDLDASGGAENSIVLVINATPVEGVDVELGYISAEETTAKTENDSIIDLNVAITMVPNLTLALEYADFGGSTAVAGSGIGILASYAVNDATSVALRYDTLEGDAAGATADKSTTIAVLHSLADNLGVNLEYRDDDVGTGYGAGFAADGSQVALEFVATF